MLFRQSSNGVLAVFAPPRVAQGSYASPYCAASRILPELSPGPYPLLRHLVLLGSAIAFLFSSVGFSKVKPDDDVSAGPLQVQLDAPEADVLQVVGEVASDQIVHGTWVYEKDKILRGAHTAKSSSIFGPPPDSGTVLYKVAQDVVDPRHFKASNGSGTLAVRYIVKSVDPARTTLQIDAAFRESSRRRTDHSDGSVEAAEYQAIEERMEALHAERQQAAQDAEETKVKEAEARKLAEEAKLRDAEIAASREAATDSQTKLIQDLQRQVADLTRKVEAQEQQQPLQSLSKAAPAPKQEPSANLASALSASSNDSIDPNASLEDLQQMEKRIAQLRRKVEATIREDGTALRSAPLTRASSVQLLPSKTPVLILVLTPNWYGVETTDGHHGWIRRSQVVQFQ